MILSAKLAVTLPANTTQHKQQIFGNMINSGLNVNKKHVCLLTLLTLSAMPHVTAKVSTLPKDSA